MKNIFKLFHYIKGFYLRISAIAGFSLIIAAINAYRPQVYKHVVDTVTKNGGTLKWTDVTPYIWILIFLSILWVVVNYAFNISSMRIHLAARSALRRRVFEKLTSLNVDYFEINRPGAVLQKTGDAINSFSQWVMSLNFSLLGPIFSLLVITIILFMSNILLGFLSLAIIINPSFKNQYPIKKNKPSQRKWRKFNETSTAIFSETIQNMATISTLSSFSRFHRDLGKAEDGGVSQGIIVRGRWQRTGARITFFNEFMWNIAILIILAEVIQGRIGIGEFVALTSYFGTIRSDAGAFAGFMPDTERVERDVERLVEVLETDPVFPSAPSAIPLTKLESLEFRNVSFSYPESKKGAIKDINFRVEKNHSIALVGPSGVGKSTITKLMLRFYAPTSGEIFINDHPADTYTHESVREHIGMVMQDVALFNTTVKENLRLAKAKATMAQLEHAADQAHASTFIDELPKQYNTIVGERGVKLSGGQKQRIAIARAILKSPDLIILDEATSALDSESERAVQAGLKQLMQGRLSLTIAHRLSTVRHADEIIVLAKGTVAERGTHPELIKKPKGLYRKLFDLQSATGKVSL